VTETQSALLVPVPEAEPVVGPFRQRSDSSPSKGVPAHVTVLFPFVPPAELSQGVEDELRDAFAPFPPFEFRLARVARWPLVVYLAPDPAEPFMALTEAAVTRFPRHPPHEGRFHEVVPHLTVAECETEGWCEDADAVLAEVESAIVGGVPIDARAGEVWLMVGAGRWTLRSRFALGG
jgi:2'-5' RNA ligase